MTRWCRLSAIALFSLVTTLPCAAQQSVAAQPATPGSATPTGQSAPQPTTVPVDPNKTFKVAVSVFQGEELSSENDYLKQSLPLLLLQTISALGHHRFDGAELAAYQRAVLSAAIEKEQERINTLYQQRATLLFESTNLQKDLEASTKSIDAAKARLAFLEQLDPAVIAVERDKPVEVVSGANGEPLVPFPMVSAAQSAKEMNLGVLVSGRVAEVEGYFVVTIDVFDAALGNTVYHFKKVFSTSNVLDAATEVADHLAQIILGRDFGTLKLLVHPSSALVYLDGTFYGVGSATIPYVATGTHSVEVRAPGYRSKTVSLTVSRFSETAETVTLNGVQRPQLVVSSVPSGADVYLASEWQGKTPLIVARPSSPEALVLRMKGYHDYTTTVGGSSPAQMSLRLLPEVYDAQQRIDHLRNRFYGSFGAFALSMIIPVTSYSMLQQYSLEMQTTTSAQEYEQLKNQFGVWYYAYLGGAFVSVALFTNTVIDIVNYLQAIR